MAKKGRGTSYTKYRRDMGMNAVMKNTFRIPIVYQCCYCIPLKTGLYVIALLGILPTIACLILSSAFGRRILEEQGIPKHYEIETMSYVYFYLGIAVLLCHFLLFLANLRNVRLLFTFYLFKMIFYIIVSFLLAVFISVIAIKKDHVLFGLAFLILGILYSFILVYFWIVVHSQSDTVKEDSNVVNINVLIM